jgi:hypothetical protein
MFLGLNKLPLPDLGGLTICGLLMLLSSFFETDGGFQKETTFDESEFIFRLTQLLVKLKK